MMARTARVRLVDDADEIGRTTTTLLGSLTARLAVLHLTSGADAIGSIIAGYAELGREVARTADGARLRRALESGQPGQNGNAIWKRLGLETWVSTFPPAPMLDMLRNDLALLLADDVEATLDLMPIPSELNGPSATTDEPALFVDFLLGLWAFSNEIARGVEVLAAPTLLPPGSVADGSTPLPMPEGELLR
jgi:hypothetical protein